MKVTPVVQNLVLELKKLLKSYREPTLPPYNRLCERFRVSPPTMAKAVKVLAAEGLLKVVNRGKIHVLSGRAPSEKLLPRPKARQKVHAQLLARIKQGDFRVGRSLPKGRYLCGLLRTSPSVLTGALQQLEHEGMCHKVGREWKIGPRPDLGPYVVRTYKTVLALGDHPNAWSSIYNSRRTGNFARGFSEEAASHGVRLLWVTPGPENYGQIPTGKKEIDAAIKKLGNDFLGVLIPTTRQRIGEETFQDWLEFLSGYQRPVVWFDSIDEGARDWKGSSAGPYRCHFSEDLICRSALRFLAGQCHRQVSYLFDTRVPWKQQRYTVLEQLSPEFGIRISSNRMDTPADWMENAGERFGSRLEIMMKVEEGGMKRKVHEFLRKQSPRFRKTNRVNSTAVAEMVSRYLKQNVDRPHASAELANTIVQLISFDHLILQPSISAVIFANDLMARSLVGPMLKCGLEIPKRISLLAFDNLPLGGLIPWSSVDYGFGELGYQALHAIVGDVPINSDAKGNIPITPHVADHGSVAFLR